MQELIRQTVEAVLAGDVDQYRVIVRTFESDVFRWAAPLLGSRDAAEELTQEVFITAYRRLDSFDLQKSFRPWLLGIAANTLRNELRRRVREEKRMKLYSQYLEAMVGGNHAIDESDGISHALAECREQLPEAAAAAVNGRYDDGLGLESLADRLRRSVTATRQLLYRARLSLRDCVAAKLATGGSDL